MATERCPSCDRGLRDGECANRDCGWKPDEHTPTMVRPAVDRPHAPKPPSSIRPAAQTPAPTCWRLDDRTRDAGLRGVAEARAHIPPPESETRTRLREVATGDGRDKARQVAREVLDEIETHHDRLAGPVETVETTGEVL